MSSNELIAKCLLTFGGLLLVGFFAFSYPGAYENLIAKGGISFVVILVAVSLLKSDAGTKPRRGESVVVWPEDDEEDADS